MACNEATPRDAFNRVADTIQGTASENPANAWMRKMSRREILATFPSGAALLEIGCGAGADAVFFAERGYRVAALGISDRMVELARERVSASQVERRVLIWRGRIREVADRLVRAPWFPFDGAYANFSLAYEESLRDVAQIVWGLLRPGAWFIITVPNKLCVSEPAIRLACWQVRRVLGRFREPLWGTIRGSTVRFRTYTTASVRGLLEGLFVLRGSSGVPVFMPPPSFYNPEIEPLRASLEFFDNHLATRFPWRTLGDTTLFKFQKVEP